MKWISVFDHGTYFSMHQEEVLEETKKSLKLASGRWVKKSCAYSKYFNSTQEMVDYLYPQVELYLRRNAEALYNLQTLKKVMDDWKEAQNANHTMGT